jgi:adenylate cyclase class 1
VLTLDQVMLNSWNELQLRRHDGPHALLECLRDLLDALPEDLASGAIDVRCFCHNRAPAIARRVQLLVKTTLQLLRTRQGYRFVVQVQQHFHVLYLVPGAVRHEVLGELSALVAFLGRETLAGRPLYLDEQALEAVRGSAGLPYKT